MRRLALCIAILALAGCATDVSTYYQGCLTVTGHFAGQVDCLRDSVAKDAALRDDPHVQQFIATAEALAAEVKAGRLSEDAAQQKLLAGLDDVEKAEMADAGQAATANTQGDWQRPKFTSCHPSPRGGTCTTY